MEKQVEPSGKRLEETYRPLDNLHALEGEGRNPGCFANRGEKKLVRPGRQ